MTFKNTTLYERMFNIKKLLLLESKINSKHPLLFVKLLSLATLFFDHNKNEVV